MAEGVEAWHDLAVVAGGASAALTGLLFVAVSLNAGRINKRPVVRATAAQSLVLLVVPLPAAIILTTPGQPGWAVGVELLLLAAVVSTVLVIVGRSKSAEARTGEQRLGRVLDHATPNLLTCLLIAVSGLSMVVGVGGGLAWLAPAVLVALLGGIVNAWLLLTRLAED